MFMLLKSKTSAIKYVFSFIPNQSNSEIGSPLLFTTELILGFVEKGPTPPPPPQCSQKGTNLQIRWVMVFF